MLYTLINVIYTFNVNKIHEHCRMCCTKHAYIVILRLLVKHDSIHFKMPLQYKSLPYISEKPKFAIKPV